MGRLSILSTLMGTGFATMARRLKRGPLRPGWSFQYEATVAFMKATNERIVHLDAPTQRAEMELLSIPSPALKKVRREPVEAGGVPAEWFTPPGATGVKAHLEEWPEMVHNFQTFGEGFPEAVRGTAKLCEHLRIVLGGAGARSSVA